jgi:hypothetical protein
VGAREETCVSAPRGTAVALDAAPRGKPGCPPAMPCKCVGYVWRGIARTAAGYPDLAGSRSPIHSWRGDLEQRRHPTPRRYRN